VRHRECEILGDLAGMLGVIYTRRVNFGIEGVQGFQFVLKVD
jgi:hypothetical protein